VTAAKPIIIQYVSLRLTRTRAAAREHKRRVSETNADLSRMAAIE